MFKSIPKIILLCLVSVISLSKSEVFDDYLGDDYIANS
jgi:hypothetical protein